ncbi:hypothetical protein IV494_06770 [Kaistella sp. G5-32]|uniref:Lipoprotein n=1 Tax=Kaistella gelatinilytica TaxID=2787636 RepID=A0ABS0FB06_9FLAO|nr:hypothetical protein [Kaistella gelatinilytica]MBF8456883.1 hypothetical protein [Kaistella gelatinilytica]
MKNYLILLLLYAFFSYACTEKEVVENQPSRSAVKIQDSFFQQNNLSSKNIPSKVLPVKLKKTINCKDKGGDMAIGFSTECLYENYTLEQAYQKFKEENKNNDDGKFLADHLPKNNIDIPFEEYPISAKYSILKQGNLKIELLFPGGLTYITFKKIENGVKITTVNSPD